MSFRRPFRMNWFRILVFNALLWLPATAGSVKAGCHAPDRPVLGNRLSWEDDQLPGAGSSEADTAPPILTHSPCPGEVPHSLSSPGPGADPAWIAASAKLPPTSQESRAALDPLLRRNPVGSRLDRPPRAAAVHISPNYPA